MEVRRVALKRIQGRGLPPSRAPLSHGVVAGGWLYVSGMVARRPHDLTIIEDDPVKATTQCLENMLAVVEAAGGGPEDVVKVSVFLASMADYEAMNTAYRKFFAGVFPARTTVEAVLGVGRIEIDCVAYLPNHATA
jgi:2-iminobutanoate/2-iminopropanoate deaminase